MDERMRDLLNFIGHRFLFGSVSAVDQLNYLAGVSDMAYALRADEFDFFACLFDAAQEISNRENS